MSEYCPQCGYPTYMNGVCVNNDCNYPSLKSNNELARERARRREEEQRREEENRRQAEQRRRQENADKGKAASSSGSKRQASKPDWSSAAAVVGALIGLVFAATKGNLEGGTLAIAAAISGVICGFLYKQILGLLLVIGIGWVLLNSGDNDSPRADGPTQTRETQRPPAQAPRATTATSTPPKSAQRYSVVCMRNDTKLALTYTYTWTGASGSSEQVIQPGRVWRHWYPESGALARSNRSMMVRTDGNLLPGFQPYERHLPASIRPDTTCDQDVIFGLVLSGPQIGIGTSGSVWIPNLPDPFTEGAIMGRERGKWAAAPGFSVLTVDGSLVFLRNGHGVVGLSFERSGPYDLPTYTITGVRPGGSAQSRGLHAGLQIIKVDGTATGSMTLNQVASKLRGPIGSYAHVSVRDPSQNRTRTVFLLRQRMQ